MPSYAYTTCRCTANVRPCNNLQYRPVAQSTRRCCQCAFLICCNWVIETNFQKRAAARRSELDPKTQGNNILMNMMIPLSKAKTHISCMWDSELCRKQSSWDVDQWGSQTSRCTGLGSSILCIFQKPFRKHHNGTTAFKTITVAVALDNMVRKHLRKTDCSLETNWQRRWCAKSSRNTRQFPRHCTSDLQRQENEGTPMAIESRLARASSMQTNTHWYIDDTQKYVYIIEKHLQLCIYIYIPPDWKLEWVHRGLIFNPHWEWGRKKGEKKIQLEWPPLTSSLASRKNKF